MSDESDATAWENAALAAALFAVDPPRCGGVALRARAGPVREHWLGLLRGILPANAPVRRLPHPIADDRLIGGLDLAATLAAGRPVAQIGLLAETDAGILVAAMAERLTIATVARIAQVLDRHEVVVARDGLASRLPARFGLVALDEGIADDERPPSALLDRLAFHLDLDAIPLKNAADLPYGRAEIDVARRVLPRVRADGEIMEELCGAALALGVSSLRAVLLAVEIARIAAALSGRELVSQADAALAGRLVLAPRTAAVPAPAPQEAAADEQPGEDPAPSGDSSPPTRDDEDTGRPPLEDVVLAAARATIPAGILAQIRLATGAPAHRCPPGRAGAPHYSLRRGRPAGVRPGDPRAGSRLDLIETLRAAAPWQRLRQRQDAASAGDRPSARVRVRREDFRVTRFRQRAETTAVFVVDASGSSALNRLAEAKGAVEELLAECYIRRDRVALLAFRGLGTDLLLAPTRSLARAKRSLAGLPGGGGTPLASGIAAAGALAEAVGRRGQTPIVVLMTDGRANVARDGTQGRAKAGEDAVAAARSFRAAGVSALLIDTAPRPQPEARRLAREMNASYLPLPHADSGAISDAVRAEGGRARAGLSPRGFAP